MMLDEISPAELVADLIVRWGLPGHAPAGVVVGPASDTQQQAGVISIMSAGLPVIEKYSDLQWYRAQVRCLHGTLEFADTLAQGVQRDIHGLVRRKVHMASTDRWYLLHLCNVTAGPSMHYDSPETWETLLFAEIMLSDDPLN